MRILVPILTLLAISEPANALTREEILARAREYTTVSWSISDTARALHDSPLHRYREAGVSPYHSDIVEWTANHNNGNWTATYYGAPYAQGARFTPGMATSWFAESGPPAIGLSDAMWNWRFTNRFNQDFDIEWNNNGPGWGFACCSDCSGAAGYATARNLWACPENG